MTVRTFAVAVASTWLLEKLLWKLDWWKHKNGKLVVIVHQIYGYAYEMLFCVIENNAGI